MNEKTNPCKVKFLKFTFLSYLTAHMMYVFCVLQCAQMEIVTFLIREK